MKSVVCSVVAFLLIGCTPNERIPQYELMPAAPTLEQLRARLSSIQSVSSGGNLRLTRGNGPSIMFDAALVLAPPDKARVRAWKFGQAIFDLTVIPEGVYIMAPADSSHRQQLAEAGNNASSMLRSWLKLLSGSFDAKNATEHGDELRVEEHHDDGTTLLCTIDRRTMTARQYRLLDNHNKQRFSIELSRYIENNGNVWPSRIVASSEGGEIRLDLSDIEINGTLNEAAFRPPARAEKLP